MRDYTPKTALRALGYDLTHPCTGTVLVEIHPGKYKHFRFRYRLRDRHVLYRWGSLRSAYRQSLSGIWIFSAEPLQPRPAPEPFNPDINRSSTEPYPPDYRIVGEDLEGRN